MVPKKSNRTATITTICALNQFLSGFAAACGAADLAFLESEIIKPSHCNAEVLAHLAKTRFQLKLNTLWIFVVNKALNLLTIKVDRISHHAFCAETIASNFPQS